MEEKKKLIRYPGKDDAPFNARFEKLIEYLGKAKADKFTGYLKINFSQGNIGRVEKFEEILKKL